MDEDLRVFYLQDLRRAPSVLSAIRRAAGRPDRTAALDFKRFRKEPFLLYAACGLAQQLGVSVVFRAKPPRV